MADQQYVLGIAYQAGPDPRIAKGADGARDYFTAEELEKAAWRFLQDGPESGLLHIDGSEGAATIVESYIYRGPDWEVGNGVIVKAGDWLIGAKVDDDRTWQMVKSGRITGFSPQGKARRITRRTRP